jgi:hypothetical protein
MQIEHAHGVAGVALAYVPRKKIIPLDEDNNPPTNYPSLDAKPIACAPILEDRVAFTGQSVTAIALLEESGPFCNTFCIDMVMVWNISCMKCLGRCPRVFSLDQEGEEWPQVVSSPVCLLP